MNSRASICSILPVLTLAGILLSGCAIERTYPLTSTPPGKVIVLTKPATARYGFFGTLVFPAGEYVATREDAHGFLYFGSPNSITMKDLVTQHSSGGFYIPKRTNVPACYFLPDPKGRLEIGKFSELPQFKFADHRGTNEIFGAYDDAAIEAIKKRWYDVLDGTDPRRVRHGKVDVEFELYADGSVKNAEVVFSSVSDRYRHLCVRAVLESAPFGNWSPAMRKEVGSEKRKVTFTFYYD